MTRTFVAASVVVAGSLAIYAAFPPVALPGGLREVVLSFVLLQTFAALGLTAAIVHQLHKYRVDDLDKTLGPIRGVGIYVFAISFYAVLTVVDRWAGPITWRAPILCAAMVYGDIQLARTLRQVHLIVRHAPTTVVAAVVENHLTQQ